MSRRLSTARRLKLARLVLCVLLLIQSGVASAAPSRLRPQRTRPAVAPATRTTRQAAPASAQPSATGTICQQADCIYLPFMAGSGAGSPSNPEEPARPTEPEPETNPDPNPGPSASDTQAPSVPLHLHATAETTSSISLAWDAASDDVGVAGYKLYQDATLVLSSTATSATIGALAPSTTYAFAVAAYDAAGNYSAQSTPVAMTTADPAPPAPTPVAPDPFRPWNVHVVSRTHGTFELAWEAPTENPNVVRYDVMAGDTWLGSTEILELSVAGLTAATDYSVSVYAVDSNDYFSEPSDTLTVTTGLPPSPTAIAPPTDAATPGDIADDTAFLYTGADPIQTGVPAGTIDPRRVTILRGLVTDRAGAPLAGVHISVLNHAEYGSTSTRSDGMFDLAVNGGAPLTLEYSRANFLSAQRRVDTPLRDYTWMPDVALVPLDSAVSTVTLTDTATLQVAAGSAVSDDDGTRQAVLMFPAGINATLELPDGSQQPLDTLHVRATEYTVGPHGPEAMPGSLPANSGYTYAVEYSVDEALTLGARQVHFSQPVIAYVENFLRFPVGTAVPAGYYDRQRAEWIAADNGKVIKILDVVYGRAVIDYDGDGEPDYPDLPGMSDAELEQLAGRYTVGQELWRVPTPHFTPWDFNWPFGLPDDAIAPNGGEPGTDRPEDNPCTRSGSIIECQNQTLGEAIDIVGAPFQLRYSSAHAPDHAATRSLRIPISGAEIPATVKRIELDLTIAGRKMHQEFASAAELTHSFVWDRKDAYGRLAQGWHDIVAQIGFVYDGVYQQTTRFGYNGNGIPIDGSRTRQEITVQQIWRNQIGGFDLEGQGFGGWSLDIQHTYDPAGKVVYLGNGGRQSGQYLGSVARQSAPALIPTGMAIGPDSRLYYADRFNNSIWSLTPGTNPFWPYDSTRVAGVNSTSSGRYSGDNGLATYANLNGPTDVAFGDDGSMYIADRRNNRVRKVDPHGTITTFAGNGLAPSYPLVSGSVATAVALCDPVAVAAGADGNIYIASSDCSEVYRVDPEGRIIRVAGNNWLGAGFTGDGGWAEFARLNHPTDIALGPDSNLYIADTDNHRIRRVGSDGIITTVAGSGATGRAQGRADGDGNLATSARLNLPVGLDVQPDGGIYVSEYRRVRWISPEDTISTLMGEAGAWPQFIDEGQPAAKARIADLGGIVIAPDGSMQLAVQYPSTANQPNARILQVRSVMPGFSAHDIALPSADGSQLYQFTATGRHLRTLGTLTGVALYSFGYDDAGRVVSVTDRDGLVTRIERGVDGQASAIVAPYGQRTILSIDSARHLTAINNPAGETTQFGYSSGGLLARLTDPRGGTHVFSYDDAGRLIRDTNPIGGFTALDRADQAHGYTVYLTNALGDSSSVGVEQLPTGVQQSVSVTPTGASTTSYHKPDGSQVSIDARGNVTTIVESPDPRWGMQAPFVASIKIQAGDGHVFFTQTANRQVTLADANDPLSLLTQTDTVTTNGRTTTTTYDANTHTLTTTGPTGLETIRTLDERGRAIAEQTTNLAPKSYVYDTFGRLVSVTEGSGAEARTTTLSYNAAGTIASSTDPLGATTTFSYDQVGRVIRQTLPTGHQLAFSYDTAGNRISSRDAQGLRIDYEYDLQHRLIATTRDPDGRAVRTEYTYDLADYLVKQIDDAGVGRLNTTTRYTYTPAGSSTYALSSVTNALSQTTQMAYTRYGDLRSTTDPLGHTTVMTYTAQGRLAEISTPGGHTTRTTFDDEGRPIRVVDPRGSTTTSSYDVYGRLQTVTSGAASLDGQPALNQTQTYAYDINGRVIRETDRLGNASTRSYDAFGRPETISDPLDNTLTFGYDLMDRLVYQASSTGDGGELQETTYEYDPAGRPLGMHVDPTGLNLTTSYHYSRAGSADTWNLQEVVDPRGNATGYRYNSLGLRDQTIDALGQIWHFDNDNLGRLARQTDPLGHATSFTVDALGRSASLIEDGRTQQWHYNADGTLANTTDFAGRTTSFGYDAAGRGVAIDYPDGTPDVGYSYDAAGNVVSMTDGLGTTSYTYDALNRLHTRTRDGRSVGYSYDTIGRTSQIDYWGQGVVAYEYDAASRLTSLTPWGASPTSFTYRSDGQLAGELRANDVATSYDYDSAGRLIGMLHPGADSIQQFQYALDANGNRTQLQDNDGTTGYSYDALNRLTNVAYPTIAGGPSAASVPYTFDPAGNRTSDGTTSYSYDAANRISSSGYSYDGNGNLLSDGTTSYEYDAANRLVKTVKSGVTTTYGYDGNGNLIRETANGVTTDFVLDERGPLPLILGEIRSDGAELRYAYGPEGVSAQQTLDGASASVSYPLLDALGSVRQLTDANGAVTLSRSYDAFGALRHASGAGSTTLGFTGERTNPIDDTIYLRARHYSPALGRFLQRDSYAGTAERPQSLNRYTYTENNPATLTDPSGRCPLCIAAAAGAAIGAGIEYGTQVYHNYQNGQSGAEAFTNVNGGRIAEAAVQGAIAGGVGFVAGPLVGALSKTGLLGSIAAGAMEGMASSGLGQMAVNFMRGCEWDANLLQSLLSGALSGGAGGAIGWAAKRVISKIAPQAANNAVHEANTEVTNSAPKPPRSHQLIDLSRVTQNAQNMQTKASAWLSEAGNETLEDAKTLIMASRRQKKLHDKIVEINDMPAEQLKGEILRSWLHELQNSNQTIKRIVE